MAKRNKSQLLFFILIAAAVIGSTLTILRQNSGTEKPEPIANKPIKEPQATNTKTDSILPTADPSTADDSLVKEEPTPHLAQDYAPFAIQLKSRGYYRSPLDGALTLSGTFGELRSNHFHAGLDIRTGGQQGKKVYAAASGYVSRIKVSTNGYGKALYIQHPNGEVTVYGHLKKFTGAIQDAVIQKQYAQEKFEVELFPKAGSLPVKKGEVVAISGNTGGSGGPHLHFEIRGKNGHPHNPMLFGIQVKDKIKPKIKSAYVYALDQEYHYQNGFYPYAAVKGKKIKLPPGAYAIGAEWIDYLTDRLNTAGINYASLYVNGKPFYRKKLEQFPFSIGRKINTHIDFYKYKTTGKRIVKLYKDQGNTLPFIVTHKQGKINIQDGDTLHIRIEIMDFAEQLVIQEFTIECQQDVAWSKKDETLFSGNQKRIGPKGGSVNGNGFSITVPQNALVKTATIDVFSKGTRPNMCSPLIQFHTDVIPLMKKAMLRIEYTSEFDKYRSKLVLKEYDPAKKKSYLVSSKLSGKALVAGVKNFGLYYVAIDTLPPVLSKYSLVNRTLKLRVVDVGSKVRAYRALVDGQWVLLEYEPKTNTLEGILPTSLSSGEHSLQIIVTDEVGNEAKMTKKINI